MNYCKLSTFLTWISLFLFLENIIWLHLFHNGNLKSLLHTYIPLPILCLVNRIEENQNETELHRFTHNKFQFTQGWNRFLKCILFVIYMRGNSINPLVNELAYHSWLNPAWVNKTFNITFRCIIKFSRLTISQNFTMEISLSIVIANARKASIIQEEKKCLTIESLYKGHP